MPNIVDGKMNNLLRQAEERLESPFSASSSHAQPSSAVKTLRSVRAARSKEANISVRQPQTQSDTAKRNKVRIHRVNSTLLPRFYPLWSW